MPCHDAVGTRARAKGAAVAAFWRGAPRNARSELTDVRSRCGKRSLELRPSTRVFGVLVVGAVCLHRRRRLADEPRCIPPGCGRSLEPSCQHICGRASIAVECSSCCCMQLPVETCPNCVAIQRAMQCVMSGSAPSFIWVLSGLVRWAARGAASSVCAARPRLRG